MYIVLAVEIPAFCFPWLRIYSRWTTIRTLALDDYLMIVCGVCMFGKSFCTMSLTYLPGCLHSVLDARPVQSVQHFSATLSVWDFRTMALTSSLVSHLAFGVDTWYVDTQDVETALKVASLVLPSAWCHHDSQP